MVREPSDVSSEMDCDEMARSLDAYLDGELAPLEEAEAGRHLSGCPRCSALAGAEGHLRATIRAKLHEAMGGSSPRGRAPQALRERIEAALDRERSPLLRRLLSPMTARALAAFVAALAVLLFALPLPGPESDPLVEEAVQRHSRDLPLEVRAAAVGPDSVARWFDGKLDFNPAPPRFHGPEVQLVGARLSHLLDRPAAYVRYDLPRGHLGLFILDDPRHHLRQVGRALRVGPMEVRVVNARGFSVATWRRNAIVYSLVSDLDEDALVNLVRTSQPGGEER